MIARFSGRIPGFWGRIPGERETEAPLSERTVQNRWKNVALTIYLICPLALVAGLCVWIMLSLQNRVAQQDRPEQPPAEVDPQPNPTDDPPESGG